MRQNHRQGVRMARPHVDEMDAEAIDRGLELRPAFELSFAASPRVICPPIGNELSKLAQRWPLFPALTGFMLGPARVLEAPAQVSERVIRHPIAEGNRGIVGLHTRRRRQDKRADATCKQ